MTTSNLLVGVDVGGSSIGVLITGTDGRPLATYSVPTVRNEPTRAARQVADAVLAACAAAGLDPGRVAAIGVGVPGRVDTRTGVVSLALNLGWEGVSLREQLEEILGAPTSVANDVRAAAAGLVARRVLGDIDDLVYVSIGTGISAGIVVDGKLNAGQHHLAGEIGHMVVDDRGPQCTCGLRGCLETYAAGRNIAERAGTAVAEQQESSLAGHSSVAADFRRRRLRRGPGRRSSGEQIGRRSRSRRCARPIPSRADARRRARLHRRRRDLCRHHIHEADHHRARPPAARIRARAGGPFR